MDAFRFSLTDEEKASLKDLVRLRIAARLADRDPASPRPPTGKLREPHGAFVTLTLQSDRLQRGVPLLGRRLGHRPVREVEHGEAVHRRPAGDVGAEAPLEIGPAGAAGQRCVQRHHRVEVRGREAPDLQLT